MRAFDGMITGRVFASRHDVVGTSMFNHRRCVQLSCVLEFEQLEMYSSTMAARPPLDCIARPSLLPYR